MKSENDAILDDLLARWHSWQHADRESFGFAPKSVGFSSYRCSRQYDDCNGALDTDLDAGQCALVNFAAEQMLDPHRAAIYVEARNLNLGLDVWSNPRLPSEPELRHAIVRDARVMMIKKLVDAGVI